MTKHSHALIGLFSGLALGFSPSIVIMGAVFPDIDIAWGGWKGKKKKRKASLLTSHRGITHHLFLPPLLAALAIALQSRWLFYFSFGVFMHLVADLLTPMGIPYYKYRDRASLRICTTGKLSEYLVVLGWIVFCSLMIFLFRDNWIQLLKNDYVWYQIRRALMSWSFR